MTQEQILGLVRHVLTYAGGLAVAKGLIDESSMVAIVGGAVALAAAVWSWRKNKPA